jgi:hypothetical protein
LPKWHGRFTEFYLDDSGGTTRNLSLDTNSVETPQTGDTVEVTGFTDTTKKYVVGLRDSQIRAQGNFNDAANQSHAVLSGVVGGTTALKCYVFPRGSASGNVVFRGSVLCSEYSVQSGVAAAVTWTANFVPYDTNPPGWATTA